MAPLVDDELHAAHDLVEETPTGRDVQDEGCDRGLDGERRQDRAEIDGRPVGRQCRADGEHRRHADEAHDQLHSARPWKESSPPSSGPTATNSQPSAADASRSQGPSP